MTGRFTPKSKPQLPMCRWCGVRGPAHVHAVAEIDGVETPMEHYLLGVPATARVRHINGDTLDNRRENIEIVE